MAPDPLNGTPEVFTKSMWKEHVRSRRPSGPNMFSQMKGECADEGIIDAVKSRGCMRYVLGYNAVTVGRPPLFLKRTNPVPHPRYSSLFATSAAEDEFAPNPRQLKEQGNRNPGPIGNVLGDALAGLRANYQQSKITVRFEALPYSLEEDGVVPDESQRNVWIDSQPRADEISLSGFQKIYTEGGGFTTPPDPFSNAKFNRYPAEVGRIVVKSDLRVTWYGVPQAWVYQTGTLFPSRILWRIGTLNATPIFGYPKGTLLLMGAKLTRSPWTLWLPPAAPGNAAESQFQYNVEFSMVYFNPDKGFGNGGGGAFKLTDRLGWNCSPWRGSLFTVPVFGAVALPLPDGNAGKWFFSSFDGQDIAPRRVNAGNVTREGGNCTFEYTEFRSLFDAADNGATSGE